MRNKNLNERLWELKQLFVPTTPEEKEVSSLITQSKAAISQFEHALISANKNLDKLKKLHQQLKPLSQDEANDAFYFLDKEIQTLERKLQIQASYPDLANQVIAHALQKYNDIGGQLQLSVMDHIMARTSESGESYLTHSEELSQKHAKRIADDTRNRKEKAADSLKDSIAQLGQWKNYLNDDINTKQIAKMIREVNALIKSKKQVTEMPSEDDLELELEPEPELVLEPNLEDPVKSARDFNNDNFDALFKKPASRLRLEIGLLKNELSRKLLLTPKSDANYLNVLDDMVMYNGSLADIEKKLDQAMNAQPLSDEEVSQRFTNDIHQIHYTVLDFLCKTDRYSIDELYPNQQRNLEGYNEQALKLADELVDAKQLKFSTEDMIADLTKMGMSMSNKLKKNELDLSAINIKINENKRALNTEALKVQAKVLGGALSPNKKWNTSVKNGKSLSDEKELIEQKINDLNREVSENASKILKLKSDLPTLNTRIRTIGDGLANVEFQIGVSKGQIRLCNDEIQRLKATIHATKAKLMNMQTPPSPSFVLRFLSYMSSLFAVFFFGVKKSAQTSEASLQESIANDLSKVAELEKTIKQLSTQDPHLDHDVNELKLNAVSPVSPTEDQVQRDRAIDSIIERCEKKQFGGHQQLTFGLVAYSYSESELAINSLLKDYLKLMKNNNPVPAKVFLDALHKALLDYQRELNGRPPNHRIMINFEVAREYYRDLPSVSQLALNSKQASPSKTVSMTTSSSFKQRLDDIKQNGKPVLKQELNDSSALNTSSLMKNK